MLQIMGLTSGSAELAKVAGLIWPILAIALPRLAISIAAISAIALIGIAVGIVSLTCLTIAIICIPASLQCKDTNR